MKNLLGLLLEAAQWPAVPLPWLKGLLGPAAFNGFAGPATGQVAVAFGQGSVG
jgi:hypothetical protein